MGIVGLHGGDCWVALWGSFGLHGGVLGYMVGCWITWQRVLGYMVESVGLHGRVLD